VRRRRRRRRRKKKKKKKKEVNKKKEGTKVGIFGDSAVGRGSERARKRGME
jgi:predicted nucleotidyltransferase